MVLDKMAAISRDFKWVGFRTSDPIQNLHYLQPNLFTTILNPDFWGRFHRSWAHGANHRDSSIKVGRTAQSALYASKKLLKSWA